MARTKADGGGGSYRKVVAARAPRKVLRSCSLTGRRGGARRGGGSGPAACARPTPAWQRGIAEFLPSAAAAAGSGPRPEPGPRRRLHRETAPPGRRREDEPGPASTTSRASPAL